MWRFTPVISDPVGKDNVIQSKPELQSKILPLLTSIKKQKQKQTTKNKDFCDQGLRTFAEQLFQYHKNHQTMQFYGQISEP